MVKPLLTNSTKEPSLAYWYKPKELLGCNESGLTNLLTTTVIIVEVTRLEDDIPETIKKVDEFMLEVDTTQFWRVVWVKFT